MSDYKNQDSYRKLVRWVILVRLFFGAIIFFSVWVASIVTFVVDWIDGEIFKRAGYTKKEYTHVDKILDYYWYILIIIYLLVTNNSHLRFFLVLFLYRTLGHFIYQLKKNRLIFFFFPNVFEPWFYFYLVTLAIKSLERFMSYPQILIPLTVILIVALIREYVLHVKQMNLSGVFTRKTTYWVDEVYSGILNIE